MKLYQEAQIRALNYVFNAMTAEERSLLESAEIRLGSHSSLDAPYILILNEDEATFNALTQRAKILAGYFDKMLPRFVLGIARKFPFAPTAGTLTEEFSISGKGFCLLKSPVVVEVYDESTLRHYCTSPSQN